MDGRGLFVVTESDDQSTITSANTSSSPSESPHSRSQGTAHGWPRVAKLIAETPEWQAFPRFRELNVKILLYYQVELDQLQADLRDAEGIDSERKKYPNAPQGLYGKYADKMIEYRDSDDEKRSRQWGLVIRIRTLLKEYNAALHQHAQISALPHPDSDNIKTLRQWLKRPDCGNHCIGGKGIDAWGLNDEDDPPSKPLTQRILPLFISLFRPRPPPVDRLDLAATCPRPPIDGFTRWVSEEWIPFYDDCRNAANAKRGMDDQGLVSKILGIDDAKVHLFIRDSCRLLIANAGHWHTDYSGGNMAEVVLHWWLYCAVFSWIDVLHGFWDFKGADLYCHCCPCWWCLFRISSWNAWTSGLERRELCRIKASS
ncbi:hypothetical protein DL764_004627 [Monosporascus ibericus]|uniref:DUF6594 domain-containing protein n=1 Tax=Monosporascus ibericus TaxID=155417 RepID=A0A4Q4TBX9_9PEZI|nr:hypothetical protein DL764_004627 [Monosporascus ibericus]